MSAVGKAVVVEYKGIGLSSGTKAMTQKIPGCRFPRSPFRRVCRKFNLYRCSTLAIRYQGIPDYEPRRARLHTWLWKGWWIFVFEKREKKRWGTQSFAIDCFSLLNRIRTAATDTFRPISWQVAWHPIREWQDTKERNTHEDSKKHSEGLKCSEGTLSCP